MTRSLLTLVLPALLLSAPVVAQSTAAVSANAIDMGAHLFEQRQYSQARGLFELTLKADPENARATYYLGRLEFQDKRYGEAAEHFERATRLDPASSLYQQWLGRAYGLQARRASFFRQPSLARRTKAAMDRAVALDPDNIEARADLISYYREAPKMVGGSMDRAFEQAEEIRRRHPARGQYELGALYERKKKYDDAERAYLAAVSAAPDSSIAQYRLGALYQTTKRYDEAFAVFERLAAERPQEPAALYEIGRTGALSGQRLERAEEALHAYLQAAPAEKAPPLQSAHYQLGVVLERRGDPAGAKAAYEAALQLDPKYAEAREALKRLR